MLLSGEPQGGIKSRRREPAAEIHLRAPTRLAIAIRGRFFHLVSPLRFNSAIGRSNSTRERDAYTVLLAPPHLTLTGGAVARDQKIERLGDAQRAGDFERRTGIRQIPNHTINRAAVEFYGAGFQYAVPRRSALALQIKKRFRLLFCGACRPGFRVQQCGCDVLFRECGPKLGPCELKTKLAILEIDGGTSVIGCGGCPWTLQLHHQCALSGCFIIRPMVSPRQITS